MRPAVECRRAAGNPQPLRTLAFHPGEHPHPVTGMLSAEQHSTVEAVLPAVKRPSERVYALVQRARQGRPVPGPLHRSLVGPSRGSLDHSTAAKPRRHG